MQHKISLRTASIATEEVRADLEASSGIRAIVTPIRCQLIRDRESSVVVITASAAFYRNKNGVVEM